MGESEEGIAIIKDNSTIQYLNNKFLNQHQNAIKQENENEINFIEGKFTKFKNKMIRFLRAKNEMTEAQNNTNKKFV